MTGPVVDDASVTTGRTVLVVQPDADCPADLFGEWFREAGLALHVVRPYAGDRVPASIRHDAVLVLGGAMGAEDDHEHPWLADVRRLLAVAAEQEVPTFGVCLGGQLLASALGGRVVRGERGPEIGVVDLRLAEAAGGDEAFAGLPRAAAAATYHHDVVVELPDGAVVLAGSDVYPHQAFRVGPAAWGVQFHPEVSVSGFERWAAGAPPADTASAAAGSAVVRRRATEVATVGRVLALGFAKVVSNRSTTAR